MCNEKVRQQLNRMAVTIIGRNFPKGNGPILQHSVADLNRANDLPWLTEMAENIY